MSDEPISENLPYAFPPDEDRDRLAVYGLLITGRRERVYNQSRLRNTVGVLFRAKNGNVEIAYLPESGRYRYVRALWRQLARFHPGIFGKAYERNGTSSDFEINRFIKDLERLRVAADPERLYPTELFGSALRLYGSSGNMPAFINPPYEMPVMSLAECYELAHLTQNMAPEKWQLIIDAWRHNLPVDILMEIANGSSVSLMKQFSRKS